MRDAEKPDPIFEKINQDNLMSLRLVGANSLEVFEALENNTSPDHQWDRITTLLMHAKELERWLKKYMIRKGTEEEKPFKKQEFSSTTSEKEILSTLIFIFSACKEIESEIRGGYPDEVKKIQSILERIRIVRDLLKSYLCDLARVHPDVASDQVKKLWLDRA